MQLYLKTKLLCCYHKARTEVQNKNHNNNNNNDDNDDDNEEAKRLNAWCNNITK